MTTTTTYWNAPADSGLDADGRCLAAVRPTEEEGQAFLQCLYQAFACRGLLADYKMYAVAKAGGPSYVWLKSRYGELS